MNGVRTTFMRRGYLLTALSALLLLAASTGTASAQSIGFVDSSGSVSETGTIAADALQEPLEIKIRVSGLHPVGDPRRSTGDLGDVSLTSDGAVSIAQVTRANSRANAADVTAGSAYASLTAASFTSTDEVTLVVAQTNTAGKDSNWHGEEIELTLDAGSGIDVSPAVYTVMVQDVDVPPVAKFDTPSFTLTEGSERKVHLDVVQGRQGAGVPAAADNRTEVLTVRVSDSRMVGIGALSTCATTNRGKAVVIMPDADDWEGNGSTLASTGLLRTVDATNIAGLAHTGTGADDSQTAGLTIAACDDMSDFRDAQIMLEILSKGLHEDPDEAVTGNVTVGPALVVTVDNDDAVPTLSFSPTDVTIDEGDSVSTRLIADGVHATRVGMVKLMVEGDAMVSLMHEDTMLEEMDGYVMVDMGNSNSARLTAMSHESRELQDGDMAYKAWKLVDGSSDAMNGEDSWFRVDVRGSTAVPALPLIGQLLLALFLMAGGSKLYRRRRG